MHCCANCRHFKPKDERTGDCFQKKTDAKGGVFWSAKRVKAESPVCDKFSAKMPH